MRIFRFILMQVISIIIEYLLLFLFLHYLVKIDFIISISIAIGLLILGLIISIISSKSLQNDETEKENIPNDKLYESLNKLIVNANDKYHLNLKLIFIKFDIVGVAFSVGNNIYINQDYDMKIEYLQGVLAHEIGHHISKLCRYSLIDTIKISTALSKIFHFFYLKLMKTNHFKWLGYIMVFFHLIFSLNNLIFTYPFLYNDEYLANHNACTLGYGEHLRCYYSMCLDDERSKLDQFLDFTHPSTKKMMDKMNKELKIDEKYYDYYFIDHRLYYYKTDVKELELPPFITILRSNAVRDYNLIKITSSNILKVDDNAFRYTPNLKEISFPAAYDFSKRSIRSLKIEKLNIKIDESNLDNIYDTAILGINTNQLFGLELMNQLKELQYPKALIYGIEAPLEITE